MASFLIWSESGDGAFFGLRLKREGHRVRLYIHDAKSKNVYRGLLDHVDRPNPTKADVVLFDMCKFGKVAAQLQKQGIRTIGASELADTLELNRTYGIDTMRRVGIEVPETYTFTKLQQGLDFVAHAEGEWFYKPYGNQDSGFTFGGEASAVARFMRFCGTKYKPDGFLLQKKVDGLEISLEGWFDGTKFVYPFNSTFEDKKFMVGNLGPHTGCMANVVWAYDEPEPILALKTLLRMTSILSAAHHVGPVDINLRVAYDGTAYGLEWTPRFGYAALQSLSALMPADMGEKLVLFSEGKLAALDIEQEKLSLGINVSIPPYPHHHIANEWKGLPLDETLLENPDTIMLADVMSTKTGTLEVAGVDCCIGTFNIVGTRLDHMRTVLLESIPRYNIPNAQYRTDPVRRAEVGWQTLARLGYEHYEVPISR